MSKRELPDSVIEYHLKASTDLERARLWLSGSTPCPLLSQMMSSKAIVVTPK